MVERKIDARELPTVDWAAFDAYPLNTIECACGGVYRSHSKMVKVGDRIAVMTRLPCPRCGEVCGNVRAARSDPEYWSIAGRRQSPE